ncbi:MAG: preprotein translocase subunit SecG [Holosporales bacterium]|jgi:preprotein translocase subunit SecG|nr:preprotein translocase subunit SecG [Holosporales bacterium]
MMTFLLSLHFVITIMLVTVILLQKSEGGAWGMGGGSGGVLTPRGQANLLTRATAILAGLFVVNCLVMASYVHHHHTQTAKRSLIDEVAQQSEVTQPVSSTQQPSEIPADVSQEKSQPEIPADVSQGKGQEE